MRYLRPLLLSAALLAATYCQRTTETVGGYEWCVWAYDITYLV